MTTKLTDIQLNLAPSGIATLSDSARMRIRCETGRLWVTVERDRRDHWLQPGESVEITSSGKVVIEADRPSELSLIPLQSQFSLKAAKFVRPLKNRMLAWVRGC